jgi:hypothetical protein
MHPYDPFRPEPNSAEPERPAPTRADSADDTDELDSLTKNDLIDLAKSMSLPIYGTKAELAERIRAAR